MNLSINSSKHEMTRHAKRVLLMRKHQQNRLFIALDCLVVANHP